MSTGQKAREGQRNAITGNSTVSRCCLTSPTLSHGGGNRGSRSPKRDPKLHSLAPQIHPGGNSAIAGITTQRLGAEAPLVPPAPLNPPPQPWPRPSNLPSPNPSLCPHNPPNHPNPPRNPSYLLARTPTLPSNSAQSCPVIPQPRSPGSQTSFSRPPSPAQTPTPQTLTQDPPSPQISLKPPQHPSYALVWTPTLSPVNQTYPVTLTPSTIPLPQDPSPPPSPAQTPAPQTLTQDPSKPPGQPQTPQITPTPPKPLIPTALDPYTPPHLAQSCPVTLPSAKSPSPRPQTPFPKTPHTSPALPMDPHPKLSDLKLRTPPNPQISPDPPQHPKLNPTPPSPPNPI